MLIILDYFEPQMLKTNTFENLANNPLLVALKIETFMNAEE